MRDDSKRLFPQLALAPPLWNAQQESLSVGELVHPHITTLPPPLTIHLPSSSHTSSDVNYVSTHICHTNSYCYAEMHSRTDTQVAPTSIIIEQLKQDNTWSYQHVTYWFYRHNIQRWEGFQLFNFIELILNKPFDRLKWGFLLKAYSFLIHTFILLSKYVLIIR